MDGIKRGGYKLVYTDSPTDYHRQVMSLRKYEDFTYSLGFQISTKDMALTAVLWDSPAFKAGLTVGSKLLAVNGIAYDKDRFKEVIREAKTIKQPIELLVQNGDHFRIVKIDYHDGLRYPRLLKEAETPSLDAILAPKP